MQLRNLYPSHAKSHCCGTVEYFPILGTWLNYQHQAPCCKILQTENTIRLNALNDTLCFIPSASQFMLLYWDWDGISAMAIPVLKHNPMCTMESTCAAVRCVECWMLADVGTWRCMHTGRGDPRTCIMWHARKGSAAIFSWTTVQPSVKFACRTKFCQCWSILGSVQYLIIQGSSWHKTWKSFENRSLIGGLYYSSFPNAG